MNNEEIRKELVASVADLNNQIHVLVNKAEELGIGVYELRDSYGAYMMTGPLVAKVQALNTLVCMDVLANIPGDQPKQAKNERLVHWRHSIRYAFPQCNTAELNPAVSFETAMVTCPECKDLIKERSDG